MRLLSLTLGFAMLAGGALAQAPVAFPGLTPVGQSSSAMTVTVTMTSAGLAATPQVLTFGIANLDYALQASSGPNACAANHLYNQGDQCTVQVVFTPKFPGLRLGAVVVESSTNGLMGETLLSGSSTGALAVEVPGVMSTVAGNAFWLYGGDNVVATAASIFLPTGLVTDAAGNMYLSDSSNNRIRYINKATGIITTYAGNGTPSFNGDGLPAGSSTVNGPSGMALDGAGNLYFADTGNDVVRRIDAVTRIMTTVAGTGGVQGYAGDTQLATTAKLSMPEGVAFDAAGNLYITDTGNNVIREVNATTGMITTIAGTGTAGYTGDNVAATATRLDSPWGLQIGPDGNLYFADMANHRIREVNLTSGIITTVAGAGEPYFTGDGGSPLSADLNEPADVKFDPAGDMYIADAGNDRIREVSKATGYINTIAGTGDEQFEGDNGPANAANLYGPYALYFDQSGNLFIADMFHNRIREVAATGLTLPYATIRVSKVSAPQAEAVQNAGNATLTLAAPTLNQTALDPATTTCNTGSTLTIGSTCNLGIEFAPTVLGTPATGSVSVNSNAADTPTVVNVYGDVLSVNPTTTAVISSLNPSMVGNAVTFTATVSSGGATLSGNITFLDGSIVLCTQAINANSSATCTVSTLALGSHSITASYAGDASDASSVSPALIQVVKQPTTLMLSASPNPAVVTGTVTLTVTAAAATGMPTGTVTFYDGTTAIGSANLDGAGTAIFTTTQLSAATHSISVQYAGDANDASATSNTVKLVVNQATTVTMLSTSATPVAVGTTITFAANVTSTNGPAPTGSVQFTDGTTVLGSSNLDSNGNASLNVSTLAPGSHKILAAYSGDADDNVSTSSALIEVVNQINTVTTLSSSLNPANAGATVLLSANVSMVSGSTADGAITGTVTFTQGATVLGSATVDANGNASISVTTLPVGPDSIVASYAGNTNYAGSTSATLIETVNQTSTTTALTSNNANAYAGKSVTFTATVKTATGIATGTVAFFANGSIVGTGTVSASGVATLTLSTLAVGPEQMTAVYSGDSNYTTSTSPAYAEVISKATPTVTLAGPASPVDAGVSLTFTGTISSLGVTPTGALTLMDGTQALATQNAPASGSFTFTISSLSVASHSLSVVYAGDADNNSASSNVMPMVVQLAPTKTSLASSSNPQILGQSVTFTAAVSSDSPNTSGTITFYDGSTAIGSVIVNAGGNATLSTAILTFGSHTITAVYSGDANHATSTSPAVTQQIAESAGATLTSSVNPSVAGQNVAFTMKLAGVGSVVPTGSISFFDGANALGAVTLDGTGSATLQVATLSVNSHTIKATYAGDTNYASTSASLIQTVQNANTQITLTSSANPVTYQTPVSLVATITSNGSIATGTVTFMDGSTSLGSAVLNASGVATLTLSSLTPGTHSIVADYAGDGKAGASVSNPLLLVVKQTTTIAVVSSSDPAQTLTSLVLTATVTNSGATPLTGSVTFTDGSTQLGTATVNAGGVATINVASLSAGNHSIIVSYTGDGNDFPVISTPFVETISLRPTTTTLTASETNVNNTQQVTLISVERWSGTTTPTGTVTFLNGSTVVGSSPVDGTGVATLTIVLQSSSASFTANYAGDTVYAGSSSPSVSVSSGQPIDFTMTLSPSTMSLQSKQHSTTTLTIASIQNFADTLQLGCVGLPTAASCTFTTTQAKLAAGGTTTVTITVDTGDPLGSGAESASVGGSMNGMTIWLLPIGLLASIGLYRKRTKSLLGLLLVLCAIFVSLGVTGCAGLSTNGTPAGNYTFKVTAVGQQTGVSEDQVMTLNVSQ